MLQRYLLVWLTLLSLAAYRWPDWFPSAPDPFAFSKPYLPQLFAATMFAIGCLLPRDEIAQVLRRWPMVFGGTAIQYTLMPLLAFVIGRAFGLRGDLLLGIIVVGCVPGAMASNVLTLTARGNVSYSVSLTTLATLLSPLIVPLALYATLRQTDIDRGALVVRAFIVLTMQVVGPVVAGHLLSRKWRGLQQGMRRLGPLIANLAILWIIAVIVNDKRDVLAQAGAQLAGILLLINIFGYLGGFVGGTALRLPPAMRRALTLEVGMQNAGLGSVLAGQLFPDNHAAALPPALYMFGCMLTGTVLAGYWALRSGVAAPEPNATGAVSAVVERGGD